MAPQIKYYSRCECGAITLVFCHDDEQHKSYSCKAEHLSKFINIDLTNIQKHPRNTTHCCDHCVNHYGLDLCGCGSGEPFGHCDNHYPECKQPMQIFGQYDHVVSANSWLAQPEIKSEPKTDSLTAQIADLITLEQQMQNQLNQLKQKLYYTICNEIETTPIDGVRTISKNMCIVQSSALDSRCWAAEYYHPSKQADLIAEALSSAKTIKKLISAIQTIISEKKVMLYRNGGRISYPINDTTLSILKKCV